MEQVQFVYKILPSEPQAPIPVAYPLSDLDRADGFVHLSTGKQVEPATLRSKGAHCTDGL